MAVRNRLTLDLSTRMDAEISRIAAGGGTSKANVLRRALSLLFAADRAKDEGMHVGAFRINADGSRSEREFVLP